MLDNIKILLGISTGDKDQLLNVLIMQCTDDAIAYTHNNCVGEMESVITQMVIYRYNILGTEGLTSESYSGLSYNYSNDYPENIIRMLKKYIKLQVW